MEQLLAAFEFWQILVLFGIALAIVGGILLILFSRGGKIAGKNTTLMFNSKRSAENLITILEAFKIKDDIHEIDSLVLSRQKKYLKGKIPEAQSLQLEAFSRAQKFLLNQEETSLYNPFENRDYLYYSLLLEKVYSGIFRDLIEIFDNNAVESVDNSARFSRQIVEEAFKDESTIIDSMYLGIESLPKSLHDEAMFRVRQDIIDVLMQGTEFAIRVAKKGAEKKESLKVNLLEKASKLDGVAQEQLTVLFKDISEDDFLNLT